MHSFSDKDKLFMLRALELAEMGRGSVSPNPMVGCVVVHNELIIGEGYHQQYGEPHAEVNAIASVKNKALLPQSTVYVTLEPCAHFGKTPPCADLLVTHNVQKVIVATLDDNPLVGGKGIAKLEQAGIEVAIGLMKEEADQLNARFFTTIQKSRPYILLKWAQTADGFIARKNYDSKWISNPQSRKLVHQWRAEEDAIMVGTNTAKHDNPQLNVRDWKGKDPIRVVIDKQLNLGKDLKLFDGSQPTLCYYQQGSASDTQNSTYIQLPKKDFISLLFKDLHERKIQSILVEGGSFLLQSLIDNNLWDEARIFTGATTFDEGIAAPSINGTVLMQQDIAGDSLTTLINQ